MGARFAKVDINLDSHPKIRIAGNLGRQVFEFVLRKNAALDLSGRVPDSYVEPGYLAFQLMVTKSQAAAGLSRAVTAGLLVRDSGEIAIVGWDEGWSRRPATDAERKAAQRGRALTNQTKSDTSDSESRNVTIANVTKRDVSRSHVEIREKREEREAVVTDLVPSPKKPDRAAEIADLVCCEINRIGKHNYDPKAVATVDASRKLARKGPTDAEILVVVSSRKGWVGDEKMHRQFSPTVIMRPCNFYKYLEEAKAHRPNGRSGPVFLAPPESDEPDPQGAMKLT